LVVGPEAGLRLDELAEDAAAEVELLGLGVLAGLGFECQGQQAADVAGQQARALGLCRGFGEGCELLQVECAYLPVKGQAEEAFVEARWQPIRGHLAKSIRFKRRRSLSSGWDLIWLGAHARVSP